MKRQRRTQPVFPGLALLLLIATLWLSAQPRPPRFALANTEVHAIHWSTVDSGGGSNSNSTYTLSGTIAQHDAGPPQGMSSSNYALHGGFWPGATPAYHHYLPIIH